MWINILIAVICFVAGFGFAAVLNMARDERRKNNWFSMTEDKKEEKQ